MRSWQGLAEASGVLGLILGLAWAGLMRESGPEALSGPGPAIAGSASDSLSAEIAELGAALAEEREARRELAEEVQRLRRKLERLAVLPPIDPAPSKQAISRFESGHPAHSPAGKLRFDESGLTAAGVPPDVAERLRERFDSSRMEELYLRDQATREGWLQGPQYRQQLQDLRAGLREEIGDEDYDLMLFATGQNNRVIVRDVLQGSPAQQAGLQAGDIVHSYDGRRIFDHSELRGATTKGKAGATVAIDVVQGDETLRFYLARGPIGITMSGARRAPDTR